MNVKSMMTVLKTKHAKTTVVSTLVYKHHVEF